MTKTDKRFRSRFYLWTGGLILAVVVAGALYATCSVPVGAKISDGETYRVERGPLVISVLENGNLKALNSLDIRSEVEGTTTIIRIVPEGTHITEADVARGTVLVELDSAALRDKATQQAITTSNAKAELQQAVEDLQIQLKQNDSDIQAGKLDLKFALLDLERYLGSDLTRKLETEPGTPVEALVHDPGLGGEALQKRRILESDIDLAEEEVRRTQNKLGWTRKLEQNGYVTRDELEADKLALKRKEVDLERAQTALDLFVRYDFSKETQRLRSNFRESRQELERIRARARSLESLSRAKLDSKKLNHELQTRKLAKLNRQIDRCIIRATRPGLVVYASGGSWRRRQDPIEEGASVRERQELIRLPDLSVMAVEVKVIESAVKKVKVGQRVRITLDAYPDMSLTGRVNKVAVVPDSQVSWMNPDLKVYSTEIIVDGRHPHLKPGLTAKVEIVAQALNDVLRVPVNAVFARDSKSVCYVLKDDVIEVRQVVMGNANRSFVHIKSGLEPGDSVMLREPRPEEPVVAGAGPRSLETPSQAGAPDPVTDSKV